MVRGLTLVLALSCTTEPNHSVTKKIAPTPVVRDTCRADPDAARFEVCVVDEAGRPLAGVAVHVAFTRFSGSGPYTDNAGVATTDATGLATLERPKPPPGQTEPRRLWAIAERDGWPPQAESAPGRIVLGPPRTIRGTLHFAKPCTKAGARIGVNNRWEHGLGHPRPTYLHHDLDDERTFTLEGIGPGTYQVFAMGCDDTVPQAWTGEVRGTDLVGRTLELQLAPK